MKHIEVEQFICGSDNYGLLVHDPNSLQTIAIDTPDGKAIEARLDEKGWLLTAILTTHHHFDHVDGHDYLKQKTGAVIYGPEKEQDKIPQIDHGVKEGDKVPFGDAYFQVIEAPGHTLGHICYYSESLKLLFAGDALFSLGCGRMFEGTPGPMWEGLKKLQGLPDDTMLYCGHEYSLSNARFALSVDPNNESLKKRANEIEQLRDNNEPTLPIDMGMEKQTNPFLRCDDASFILELGLEGQTPDQIFAHLRRKKDQF